MESLIACILGIAWSALIFKVGYEIGCFREAQRWERSKGWHR